MMNFGSKIVQLALAFLARKVVGRNKPFVVAVTGSVGKTSTKEAIYQVLADHFGEEVRKNSGNLNTEIGLPLAILGYEKVPAVWAWPMFLAKAFTRSFSKTFPKYLVLELGVDKPGDMAHFATIFSADIAVITSVAGAHLANFHDLSEYQAEKLKITELMKSGGTLIVNDDERILSELKNEHKQSYGISSENATFRAVDPLYQTTGTDFRINSVGQKIAIHSHLLGEQGVYALLAGYVVGQSLGFQSLEVKKSLESVEPLPGRMRLIAGKNNCVIIDDSYNSNPASLRAALSVLAEIKYSAGRKVAIVGNMNELGPFEEQEHIAAAKFAQDKTDLIIFAGPNARKMSEAVSDRDKTLVFRNRLELEKDLSEIIKKGDLILVKASQNGNFFEEITKKLMKEPEKAGKLLVRQGKEWRRKKH